MTCRQIVGACDTYIFGNTPEELMENCTQHIVSMKDDGHRDAMEKINEINADLEEKERRKSYLAIQFNFL